MVAQRSSRSDFCRLRRRTQRTWLCGARREYREPSWECGQRTRRALIVVGAIIIVATFFAGIVGGAKIPRDFTPEVGKNDESGGIFERVGS